MIAGRGTRYGGLALALVLVALATASSPPLAQPVDQPADQSLRPVPFLIVNQERLLTESQRGQALLAEQEAARDR
jgi:hypothetical protein